MLFHQSATLHALCISRVGIPIVNYPVDELEEELEVAKLQTQVWCQLTMIKSSKISKSWVLLVTKVS